MPDYRAGKIYKIVDNTTEDVYVGSTTLTLAKRLRCHESGFRQHLLGKCWYVTVYDILLNDDYSIELIEDFPCDCSQDLEAREKYYIRTTDCVNKGGKLDIDVSATVDRKEYDKQRYKLRKSAKQQDPRPNAE